MSPWAQQNFVNMNIPLVVDPIFSASHTQKIHFLLPRKQRTYDVETFLHRRRKESINCIFLKQQQGLKISKLRAIGNFLSFLPASKVASILCSVRLHMQDLE